MNKTVLVTGATGAIGEAIAKIFFDAGYELWLHYHKNRQKAEELVRRFNAHILQWDMRDAQGIKDTLSGVSVDILVNNAAVTSDSHIYWMSDEQWSSVIDTNLNGTYYVTKTILEQMIKNKRGSIVNVVSVSGMVGNHGQANYSASKGGIIALTKTLCLDLARFNIRVNAVAPGLIVSEMSKDIDEKNYKTIIPMGRFGRADEVAEAVFFLGDKGSYISGEVLNVSGGMIR